MQRGIHWRGQSALSGWIEEGGGALVPVRGVMESIFYRDGFKYVLDEDYIDTIPIFPPETIVTKWVSLSPKGKLFLRAGFGFDGPSGPTIDTKSAMRGASKHDGVYRLFRMGLLEEKWRKVADEMYEADCIADSQKTKPKRITA